MSFISYAFARGRPGTDRRCDWGRRVFAALIAGLWMATVAAQPARAETCAPDALGQAVDEVGASLRAYDRQVMPGISAKMEQLRLKKGWPSAGFRQLATNYLHDARVAGLSEKAARLLSKIHTLGSGDNASEGDCARIGAVRAAGLELLAVMKTKTAYTLAKIDEDLSPGSGKPRVAAQSPLLRPSKPPSDELRLEEPEGAPEKGGDVAGVGGNAAPPAAKPTPPAKAPVPMRKRSEVAVAAPPVVPTAPVAPAAPIPPTAPPASMDELPWQTETMIEPGAPGPRLPRKDFTIDEIRKVTRGFFGSVSTNLGSVIEYAFKNSGRPTGYVLGFEGGGAFLAGLRYGKGMLYLRDGGRRKVFWHGPSVGYDFGAAGSRTMFLIYKLDRAENLFRSFTGIDGSAYIIGGVGITFLKGGPIVMAPIRSGLGLRVGASVGYIRFTPEATWNPF